MNISIANSEKSPEGTNSIQRSQRSPWLSSSCIMSAGSWISWCRPFIRLSGAQTGRNIPVMPGRLAKFWLPFESANLMELDGLHSGSPRKHFFKPSHVFLKWFWRKTQQKMGESDPDMHPNIPNSEALGKMLLLWWNGPMFHSNIIFPFLETP